MPHRQVKMKIRNFDYSLLRKKHEGTFYRYRKSPLLERIMEWDLENDCWVNLAELDKKSARRIVAINNLYDRVIGFTPGFRP